MRTTPERITKLEPNEIFVFGSNLAGIHGAGAARDALKFGARFGIAEGPSGSTFALPTKDHELKTLPLWEIDIFVSTFLNWAEHTPKLVYLVTPIGCGLAGYKPEDIAPMFKDRSDNVILPASFHEILK